MAKIKKDKAADAAKDQQAGAAGAAKDKKDKKPSGKKEKKSQLFSERVAYSAELILAQKYTDEKIKEMVNAKYADYPGKKFDQKEMGRTRWMIRQDMIKTLKLAGRPYGRMVEHEGKLIKKSEQPKKSAKAKVDPKTDPLKTAAGLDPDKKKAEKEKKVKKIKREPASK